MSQEIQHGSDNSNPMIKSDLSNTGKHSLSDNSTYSPLEDEMTPTLVAQYVYDGLMTPEEATLFAQGKLVWQEGMSL